MVMKPKLDADLSGELVDQTNYHSKIGSLMYLTSSRPDIVQVVGYCARYQARPTKKHLKEVKRIFRYLRGTIHMGLWYLKGSGFELTAFSDADHAGCIDTRKSTSGGIQFLGDKLVSWMSKKQDCTAMSSAEAEYVALSASCAQVIWMRTQLKDYGFNYNKVPLYYDSQSAIAISCNPVQHSCTKHIQTRYHFIKEQVENGIIELYFIRSEYQLADMFTKALPEERIDQGVGSTSGIRACALRNFDLEVIELENTQNNALAKLSMLKLREYEMWEIRIKQYFQIQDYALWEVIENGNSWVPIPVTTPSETGTSTATKMTVPSTIEEKTCKKNDSMFAAIKARFGGNEATKKTQKALLKQQYENFSASSSESLDSIFNRLQRLVSRLAILGVVTPPEDLNVKFLRSLPSEWDTHVVVWMNKPDFDTMGLDDLYNNFKIVEQKVKKSTGASNDDKNLAFVTTSGASSTNNIDTVNPKVSTATTKVNTSSTNISTASFSDAIVYAFLSTQPKGSQLVHEDLEQLHDDDLEEMDLKWNMALLSMRARKFYQRTGRKIIIDGSNTAGYDKSKVECFNCHKMGHFARECRAPRILDLIGVTWQRKKFRQTWLSWHSQNDTGFKAATYKRGLTTLEDQIVKYREHEVLFSEEIALLKRSVGHKEYQMGLLRDELEKVKQEKEGFEFKIAKFDKSAKDLEQLLASQITDKSKKGFGYNVVPSPHPLILNRPTPLDLSYSGLEEFKEPEVNEYGPRNSSLKPTIGCDKESNNSKENTDDSLEQHQKTDTETSSVKSSLKVDKDWKEKFFHPANHVREVEPKKVRENNDAPIIEDWVSDDEDDDESNPKVEKKTVIPTATKKEFVKPEKQVKRSVRYAEMYRTQIPRGNQRNWNGQKSNQLGYNFVFNNKACFICGSFDHIQYSCPKHMAPRAVLMKTGLKPVNTARPVNTVRSVNTDRPFSTARSFNTVRPSYTAHPKSTIHCARPRTYFQNQAQSTVHRPFYKKTTLTNRCLNKRFNTGRPVRSTVNTVRERGFNAVKPSACWVWRPIKPNGASLSNSQLNDKGFVDSGCSRHMTGNIAHLSDFKDFDGGYVTFGGGAYGGRITGTGTIKTGNLDFDDVYFVKELKFNLFSVSQMCDKKNYVLFTDSECLVLSPNFKLPDENQILLKIPRQDNMYSFDMKNIVPKDSLTCLVAKATSEESMLWHR
ncbi:retrovirus-related pol polyprotein from transposon TNT 1-94 [Tanacetum coccineum]|uniref:Retrovirus-related pol polyprotein from transposon TNT 1-94 n=1 Tax=Tanacetum coccineum TaxID=301880 RepID=A0ABQ5D980_9ASTR